MPATSDLGDNAVKATDRIGTAHPKTPHHLLQAFGTQLGAKLG